MCSSDINISQERLHKLPEEEEISDIQTLEYEDTTAHTNDMGPAKEQYDQGLTDEDVMSHSSVLLPDTNCNIREKVENIVI